MHTHPAPPPQLNCRESAHNLHISVGQTLDMPQAEGIMQLLHARKDSCKRFFIDVRQVTRLEQEAAASLRASLPLSQIGMQRIAFKGRLGFELAVGGNKALVANLPTLGGRALALTLAGVAGSLIGVLLIRRHFPGAGPGGRAIAAAEQKERAGSPADAAGLATAFKDAPLPPRGTASGGADDGR